MNHLVCITICIIHIEGNFQSSWPICTSHLLQRSQNVSNWRFKQFSPSTWQPAFYLQKGEPEEGKYCLMSHCKTDNHSPLCCQISIQVPCSNFQRSVMPLLLETASLAAAFNTAPIPVNGDIITHIKCIYPHQRGTIHRPHWVSINSEL